MARREDAVEALACLITAGTVRGATFEEKWSKLRTFVDTLIDVAKEELAEDLLSPSEKGEVKGGEP